MDVQYHNQTVKEQCTNLKRAKRDFPEKVAKKLLRRINLLMSAENLASVINFPGVRFHALKGRRLGEYALDIDGARSSYRLIVYFDGYMKQQVFENSQSITIVEVREVSKHYE